MLEETRYQMEAVEAAASVSGEIFAEINREVLKKRIFRSDAKNETSGALQEQTVTYVRAGYAAGDDRYYMGNLAVEGESADPGELIRETLEIAASLKEAGAVPEKIKPSRDVVFSGPERPWMSLEEIREAVFRIRKDLVSLGLTEDIRLVGQDWYYESMTVNSLGCRTLCRRCVWRVRVYHAGREYLLSGNDPEELDIEALAAVIRLEDAIDPSKADKRVAPEPGLPAILMGRAMAMLLMTAWQSLEAGACRSGATPFADKLGERIASETVTLIDEPILGCDAEGTAASESILIENGIMRDLLGLRAEMLEAGRKPCGNAGRTASLVKSYGLRAMPRRLVLKTGERSAKALIESLENGYCITEMFDQFHALDPASGRFHFPCRGVKIENGKVVGRIEEVTLEGDLAELLSSIQAVSDHSHRELLTITETFEIVCPAVLARSVRFSG